MPPRIVILDSGAMRTALQRQGLDGADLERAMTDRGLPSAETVQRRDLAARVAPGRAVVQQRRTADAAEAERKAKANWTRVVANWNQRSQSRATSQAPTRQPLRGVRWLGR